MRTNPIHIFAVNNANNFDDEKKRVLGVGISQRLVDTEGPTLLKRLQVLVDLLLCELLDKFHAVLALIDGLCFEQACGDRF